MIGSRASWVADPWTMIGFYTLVRPTIWPLRLITAHTMWIKKRNVIKRMKSNFLNLLSKIYINKDFDFAKWNWNWNSTPFGAIFIIIAHGVDADISILVAAYSGTRCSRSEFGWMIRNHPIQDQLWWWTPHSSVK